MTENVEAGASPPNYTTGETNENPPSYDSLYGKIQNAKRRSDGNGQFLKSVCEIICNTIGFTILLIILLAIPIASIVIGALNLNDCPVQKFIPIWLIVAGSVAALHQILSICNSAMNRKHDNGIDGEENDEPKPNRGYQSIVSLLSCFSTAWFIAGCVWVYRIYAPQTSFPDLPYYCDFTTYYMAFWLITSVFIMLGFFIFCCCCILVCVGAAS